MLSVFQSFCNIVVIIFRFNFYRIKFVSCTLGAYRSLTVFSFFFFTFFLYSIAQCRIVQFITLLGISYIVNKGERLQTRRPRQFLGSGHMVFSQPLTRKTLRNFLHIFFFHFVSRVAPFCSKNKLSFALDFFNLLLVTFYVTAEFGGTNNLSLGISSNGHNNEA